MKPLFRLLLLGALVGVVAVASAQPYGPPPVVPPDEMALKTIKQRTEKLAKEIARLRTQGVRDYLLDDVEVYLKAATWIVTHGEFYQKNAADQTLAALDRGLLRASQVSRGDWPWLGQTGRAVVRGYRSAVDGSIQPYAVTLPADYGSDAKKKYRFDVVLHGRNDGMTEVSFLQSHSGDKAAPKGLDHVILDIYGRGNNAYRWAGEADVNEAIEHFIAVENGFGRGALIDPTRFVLRGFSMGGAGTWHLGLHRPDRWSVLGPGAGFTTTRGYVTLDDKLRPEAEACLHIYDAVDYAENAFDVPIVAYAGEKDKQLAAARNVEEKLKPLGINMKLLVAPGLAHQYPPEWEEKAEAEYAKFLAKGKPGYPRKIHFVTYTLKYASCYWLDILSLDEHYKRAVVDAEQVDDNYQVTTQNVRTLQLTMGPGATRNLLTVTIDGQRIRTRPYGGTARNPDLHIYLEKTGDRWAALLPERLLTDRMAHAAKSAGNSGADRRRLHDVVPLRSGHARSLEQRHRGLRPRNLQRFRNEWSRYFRGELPIKEDEEVTPDDIATKNLILFGDPASNSLIEQVYTGLPLQWTKEKIVWQGKEYAAGQHVPVLIYPNPLNKDTYVVLNSGHTFRGEDFLKSNAMLYPRLGDFAILKLNGAKKDPLGAEIVVGGLFNEFWRLPPPKE